MAQRHGRSAQLSSISTGWGALDSPDDSPRPADVMEPDTPHRCSRITGMYRRSPRKLALTAAGVLVCFVLLSIVTFDRTRLDGAGEVAEAYSSRAGTGSAGNEIEDLALPPSKEAPRAAAALRAGSGAAGKAADAAPARPAAVVELPPVAAPSPAAAAPGSAALVPAIKLPFTPIPASDRAARLAALPPAHGGRGLRPLLANADRASALAAEVAAGSVPLQWTLTPRQACDAELLLNGGFTPLAGFMPRSTYGHVVARSRLGKEPGLAPYSDELWPMPITLDMPSAWLQGASGAGNAAAGAGAADPSAATAALARLRDMLDSGEELPISFPDGLAPADAAAAADGSQAAVVGASSGSAPVRIALRDGYHNLIAVLTVTSVYRPDKTAEARSVFGSVDTSHPAVAYLFESAGDVYVGGVLEGIALPKHYDHPTLRLTPQQVRDAIAAAGWPRTVAFQTRNPMHRAHIELTKRASVEASAGVLLQPVVGMTKPGDVDAAVRVRCYQAIVRGGRHYASGGVMLALLQLAMRMAGPKEALWHAIIRKNHGASHFIVGRDHAGCKDSAGKDFYGAYDAQELVRKHEAELGISVVTFQEVEYVPSLDAYVPGDQLPKDAPTLSISGTKFRGMMARGDPIPAWYSDPDVIKILREVSPPLHQRGFALLFTGLSGGGKTTIAHGLIQRLSGLLPTRRLTFLDGDVVRTHLSRGLGFSLSDRAANVERIGWVAAEAARHGGIVLAAPIAPLHAGRRAFRKMVEGASAGAFTIYVAAPLATCAARDVKGLYAAAAGGRTDLTGVSHPFEGPDEGVDLVLDSSAVSVDDSVAMIIAMLTRSGYISASGEGSGAGAAETGADLTPLELGLLGALKEADAAKEKDKGKDKGKDKAAVVPAAVPASPAVTRLLPFFTKGTADVLSVVPALSATEGSNEAAPGSAAAALALTPPGDATPSGLGFCSAGWDRMVVTLALATSSSKSKSPALSAVPLYGGLPMQASLAFPSVASSVRRDPRTGGILAPPATLALAAGAGAAGAFAAGEINAAARAAATPGSAASALAPVRLSAAYLTAAERVAAAGAGDEKAAAAIVANLTGAGAGAEAVPLQEMGGVASKGMVPDVSLLAAARAVLAGASATGAAAPAGSGLASLPEPARVFASFNLWAHMRWSWHKGLPEPAEDGGAGAVVAGSPGAAAAASFAVPRPLSVFASAPSALLPQLPHMLRLDPCLRAVVLTHGSPSSTLDESKGAGSGTGAFDFTASALHVHALELAAQALAADAADAARAQALAAAEEVDEDAAVDASADADAAAVDAVANADADADADVPPPPPAPAKKSGAAAAASASGRKLLEQAKPKSKAAAPAAPAAAPAPGSLASRMSKSKAQAQARPAAASTGKLAAGIGAVKAPASVPVAVDVPAPSEEALLAAAAEIYAKLLAPAAQGLAASAKALAASFPKRVLAVQVNDAASAAWMLRSHLASLRGAPAAAAAAGDSAALQSLLLSALAPTAAAGGGNAPASPDAPPAEAAELQSRIRAFFA